MPEYPAQGGSGNGITSLTGDGVATGPGAANLALDATLTTAKVNVATTSLKGAMSTTDKVRANSLWSISPRQATLANADATLQPFTSRVTEYVMPAATMTSLRTLTLGNTSAPVGNALPVVAITRLDLTANSLVIKDVDGTTTLHTFSASPSTPERVMFYYATGAWHVNLASFVNG